MMSRATRALRRIGAALALSVLLSACNARHDGEEAVAASPVPDDAAHALIGSSLVPAGDVARGKAVFATNCGTCHGTTGTEGGVGPSLRDERSRKDLDATVVWIEHPNPPMPALYPQIITERDVDDLAAYVQSL